MNFLSNGAASKGPVDENFFSKNVDFSLWGTAIPRLTWLGFFLKNHVSRKLRYRNHTIIPHIMWFQREKSRYGNFFQQKIKSHYEKSRLWEITLWGIAVIVKPHKTYFLMFSCETKVMKITHSEPLTHRENSRNPLTFPAAQNSKIVCLCKKK